MARRRSSLAADASYWGWWIRKESGALLLGLGLAALFILVGVGLLRQSVQPLETVDGVIVRFGTASEYDGNSPLVLARTADGRLHQLGAHPSKLAGCTVGAPIRLTRRGGILAVQGQGCLGTSPAQR